MVEDSEDDIIATRRAWKKYDIAHKLYVVRDGEECLDFLKHRGTYERGEDAPRPHLMLLDINLPRLNGLEVLESIRSDENLRSLPVIILSTSKAERDRFKAYDLGISAYIAKPVGFKNFAAAIKTINDFWDLVEQ